MSKLTNVGNQSINREFATQPYRSFDQYQKQQKTDRTIIQDIDPDVLARLFSDSGTRVTLESWRHSQDPSKIDGGKIYEGSITLVETMDDITDGSTYGRVRLTNLSGGNVVLANIQGDLDDVADGITYAKTVATALSSGSPLWSGITGAGKPSDNADVTANNSQSVAWLTDAGSLATENDLDGVSDGATYGKVLLTSLSAGQIVLAQCTGDLDDIGDGTSYKKVDATVIDSGMVKILRLSADTNERLEITASGVEGYSNSVKTFELGSGTAYLGDQSNEHIKLSSSGLEVKDGATVLATYGSTVTIGEVGASKSNVYITSGELQMRVNTTAKLTLTTAGALTMTGGMTISGTGGWIKVYDDQGTPQLRVQIGYLN